MHICFAVHVFTDRCPCICPDEGPLIWSLVWVLTREPHVMGMVPSSTIGLGMIFQVAPAVTSTCCVVEELGL